MKKSIDEIAAKIKLCAEIARIAYRCPSCKKEILALQGKSHRLDGGGSLLKPMNTDNKVVSNEITQSQI